jgi:short-subunit dehydrogenase
MIRSLGVRVCTHNVNVADKERMRRYPDEVIAEHGVVHIVVNNAGVSVGGTFEEQTLEDWEWLISINVWGVIYGCKFFLPHLKRAGEGHIVNLSSMFGLFGAPLQSSYSTSKFAIRGLSESLWVELKQHNICVTSVHPCGVCTDIAKSMRYKSTEAAAESHDLIDTSTVTPEHVAQAIVQGIEKNKMRVLIGTQTVVIDLFKRLKPELPQKLAQKSYQRGEIKGAS